MGHLLTRLTRKHKKVTAMAALFAMGGLLLLPIFLALPALAGGGELLLVEDRLRMWRPSRKL